MDKNKNQLKTQNQTPQRNALVPIIEKQDLVDKIIWAGPSKTNREYTIIKVWF